MYISVIVAYLSTAVVCSTPGYRFYMLGWYIMANVRNRSELMQAQYRGEV